MTTKEFLIKSSYDDAGMSKFKKDCDSAMQAANELKLGLSSAAKIIDQNVSQSMNAAGDRIRTVTSLISDQGRIAKVAFTDLSDFGERIALRSLPSRKAWINEDWCARQDLNLWPTD